MAVRTDCRHYVMRSAAAGDRIQRCRLDANLTDPFGCPDGCVFYEARGISAAGWQVGPSGGGSPHPDGDVHPS
jgi:hypothetical protein